MKKVATWIVAISGISLAITMAIMGIGVCEMDENIISTTAYIAIPCMALLFGGLVYIRWGLQNARIVVNRGGQTGNTALTAVRKYRIMINGSGTLKKKALVLCICVLCLLAVTATIIMKNSTVIGSIRGAELETVIIGDTVYQYDSPLELTLADKGRFLGIVTNGKDEFRVYSVKGDTEGQYIYRLWGYDGAFYTKTD